MVRAKTLTANKAFVALTDGRYEKVEESERRAATDPLVKANPSLFTAAPKDEAA